MLIEYDLLTARVVQITHHHLFVPVDVLVVFDRSVVKRKLAAHDYLIEVEGCSFGVDEDRFFELCSLSNDHAPLPDNEHVSCDLASILDDLACVIFTVGKIHHEIVDESLLTAMQNDV